MIISQKVDCQCPADHHEYVDDTLTLWDKSDHAQCGLGLHIENTGANDAPVIVSTIVADGLMLSSFEVPGSLHR